jgi:hypothetical protein
MTHSTITHRDGRVETLPALGDPFADVWCMLDDNPTYALVDGDPYCHSHTLNPNWVPPRSTADAAKALVADFMAHTFATPTVRAWRDATGG